MKRFGDVDLIATLFRVSGILLWTSTGPDPGDVAHYMLSSAEMSPELRSESSAMATTAQ